MTDEGVLDTLLPSLTLTSSVLVPEPYSARSPSSYPPIPVYRCASAPFGPKQGKTKFSKRGVPQSAPQFAHGTRLNSDVFFGEDEQPDADDQISYHQRKHSQYPTVPTPEEKDEESFSSVDNESVCSGSPRVVTTDVQTPTSNPWKRQTPHSTLSTGSALIPRVVPVSVRVTRMLKEFSLDFFEALTTLDNFAHINKRVREAITAQLKFNAVNQKPKSPRTKEAVAQSLASVTKAIFDEGTDIESFALKSHFLGNMAFVGLMRQNQILDDRSVLAALCTLCHHHHATKDPGYLEAIYTMLQYSKVKLVESESGLSLQRYLDNCGGIAPFKSYADPWAMPGLEPFLDSNGGVSQNDAPITEPPASPLLEPGHPTTSWRGSGGAGDDLPPLGDMFPPVDRSNRDYSGPPSVPDLSLSW